MKLNNFFTIWFRLTISGMADDRAWMTIPPRLLSFDEGALGSSGTDHPGW
jgi:hypothetical protein